MSEFRTLRRSRRLAHAIDGLGDRFGFPRVAESIRFWVVRRLADLELEANDLKRSLAFEIDVVAHEVDDSRWEAARASIEWLRHRTRMGNDGDLVYYDSLVTFAGNCVEDTVEEAEIAALEQRIAALEQENERLRLAAMTSEGAPS